MKSYLIYPPTLRKKYFATELRLNVDDPILSQQGPVRIILVADRASVRPADPGRKVQQVVRDGRNLPVEIGGEVAVAVVSISGVMTCA